MGVLALIAAAFLLLGDDRAPSSVASGVPDPYYFKLRAADVNSPIEAIRFATSIRPYSTDFTIRQRVAFFEWYFKNRGFDISFVQADDFKGQGNSHVWLKLKNKLGETMYLEPSYREMSAPSISPTTPEYKRYDRQFNDIFELSRSTGGSGSYAWWNTAAGRDLWDKNIMLLKEQQLSSSGGVEIASSDAGLGLSTLFDGEPEIRIKI
ncbi:MAG: hypothetical protein GKC10_02975 [Methanosarcinales archaeon]|nr:hypothetical protein [Methanosarcinales archaeon]